MTTQETGQTELWLSRATIITLGLTVAAQAYMAMRTSAPLNRVSTLELGKYYIHIGHTNDYVGVRVDNNDRYVMITWDGEHPPILYRDGTNTAHFVAIDSATNYMYYK